MKNKKPLWKKGDILELKNEFKDKQIVKNIGPPYKFFETNFPYVVEEVGEYITVKTQIYSWFVLVAGATQFAEETIFKKH